MKKIIAFIFLHIFFSYAAIAGVVRVHPSAKPHVHENIKAKHSDENSGNRKTHEETNEWSGKNEQIKQENISDHFNRHSSDFPNLKTEKSYVKATQEFINSPPNGTLSKIKSSNGDLILYHPQSNTFVSVTKNGKSKTMFKPSTEKHGFKSNLEYFYAQD